MRLLLDSFILRKYSILELGLEPSNAMGTQWNKCDSLCDIQMHLYSFSIGSLFNLGLKSDHLLVKERVPKRDSSQAGYTSIVL